jgi:hypothetical protein
METPIGTTGETEMTINEYLIRKLNGRKWVVARSSQRLLDRGYEVFFSQSQYKSICREASANGVGAFGA